MLDFCSILGSHIEHFFFSFSCSAGLTGEKFVHTVEFGKEVVFHVSTLLPHSKGNSQQLERKRHLGNDICNIIFQEDPDTRFSPELIKSQFNHIFAVVSKEKATGHFTLKVSIFFIFFLSSFC